MTTAGPPSRDGVPTAAKQGRTASDEDQTASDRDQMASVRDQSGSDQDQAASEADARVSRSDQRASDRDQRASDRALDSGTQSKAAYDEAKADRLEASDERAAAANARADDALQRAATGRIRNLNADVRDRVAEARDQEAAIRDEQFQNGSGSVMALRKYLTELRERAAADRLRAATDRWQAAKDRKQGAIELRRADDEIEHAHLDDLTGVYRRGSGTTAIQREINRAQHSKEPLALAFIDVDKLKEVNDSRGHAAGDALLQEVVAALRHGLRSYDPIVRLGGDEFACALANATLEQASRRMDQISADVKRRGGSISFGLAELNSGDTLDTLMARGDRELYRRKGRERHTQHRNGPLAPVRGRSD